MKIKLLFLMLFSPLYVLSQQAVEVKKYLTESQWEIKVGDTILLGKASQENSYKYIKENKADRKNDKSLIGNYNSQKFPIQGITKYTWGNKLTEALCKIKINDIIYYVNIDAALYAEEIVLPSGYQLPNIGKIKDEKGFYVLNERNFLSFIDSLKIIEDDFVFENVINIDGLSKDQIFVKLRSLFVEIFKDSKNVLEINDKELGQLMGKGRMKYYHSNLIANNVNYVNFTINIMVKDGRFKYRINNIHSDYYADIKGNDYSNTHREYIASNIIKSLQGDGVYSKGLNRPTKSFIKEQAEDFLITCISLHNMILKSFEKTNDDMDDF